MKKSLFKCTVFFVLLSLFACNSKTEKELSFLTFNVWQEGTSVPNGLKKIRDVIIETIPDIVCFVEVRNYKEQDWTTKIVNALSEAGHTYYRGYAGGDVSFISKYPLENGKLVFGNTDKGTIVNFNVNVDGKTILVSGAHLDYTYYASNLPRGYNGGDPNWKLIDDDKGKPLPNTNVDSIQAYNLESTRDEAISAFLTSVEETNPVVLMGDFNEPSWLDWTEKTKDLFDHNNVIIPWHNTRKLHKEGFVDAYRTFYPNEKTHPGFTWPSYTHEKESTSWTPLADERDRIDYVFFKGDDVKLKGVAMVGPRASYVYDTPNTSHTDKEPFLASELPWPSDHKAILVNLNFTFD